MSDAESNDRDGGHPDGTSQPLRETDSRFPSGPWIGFFLQKEHPGKHWMKIDLMFAEGKAFGFGKDWIGIFQVTGRYSVDDGRCELVKQYLGKHAVHYSGFNEGRGIFGGWKIPDGGNGGFCIWPEAMEDPTKRTLSKEATVPDAPELVVVDTR
jgi:hypothetical protein